MAAAIRENQPNVKKAGEPFIDKHFAKIAFAVSTLALLILSPFVLILGSVVGFALHFYMAPNMKLKANDTVITIPNAVFAIVGATAALLRLTPAGSMGGFVFQAVPLIASLAIGSTACRAIKSI